MSCRRRPMPPLPSRPLNPPSRSCSSEASGPGTPMAPPPDTMSRPALPNAQDGQLGARAQAGHPGRRGRLVASALIALALGGIGMAAFAQQNVGQTAATVPIIVGQGAGGNSYSVPIQTLLFFTA